MLIMYKTLVRPIIDYCVPVWKPHYKNDILRLDKIQNDLLKWYQTVKRCHIHRDQKNFR